MARSEREIDSAARETLPPPPKSSAANAWNNCRARQTKRWEFMHPPAFYAKNSQKIGTLLGYSNHKS